MPRDLVRRYVVEQTSSRMIYETLVCDFCLDGRHVLCTLYRPYFLIARYAPKLGSRYIGKTNRSR